MAEAERVEHPRLGSGILVRTFANGTEWEVRFASGRRFRLPAREFKDGYAALASESVLPRPAVPLPAPAPHDTVRYHARQAVEVLRMGTVPVREIEAFTVGLRPQIKALDQALTTAAQSSGEVQAVLGDYGYGKSHFIELAAQRALKANFVVARVSLDLKETPPNKALDIYRALTASLQYPDSPPRGLEPLLNRAVERPGALEEFASLGRLARCPLTLALRVLADPANFYNRRDVARWVGGQIKKNALVSVAFKRTTSGPPPPLYANGENGRQYAYLVTAISVLARLLGYSGLAVLVDESEHYSLLKPLQRQRADTFFQALICGALARRSQIEPETVPVDYRVPDYPISFSRKSHLFFLFALTYSEFGMPVYDWLAARQIVELDERFSEQDVQQFLGYLMAAHSAAFDYPLTPERYQEVYTAAPGLLLRGLRRDRFNLRGMIQIAVHLCDLLYAYPDDPPGLVLDDLRRAW
ncbi:MAG: DUF2791 family P-loop domain-containing protein [Anaerolineae bacterium]|nr:DUF2791 family P-loop domain-containing protein [Anaerolineae bacterium]